MALAPDEPVPDIARRLEAAAAAVEETRAHYGAALSIRNRLVAEAADDGHSPRSICRWARVSQLRIQQLLDLAATSS